MSWKSEKQRHQLASRGIRTNLRRTNLQPNQLDVFKKIDWLDEKLQETVIKVTHEQYEYLKHETHGGCDIFGKYFNTEYISEEVVSHLITDVGDDVENYIPESFEYKPEEYEYINKNSLSYTYLRENPSFMKRVEELVEKAIHIEKATGV